jgi:hypothetical protein
MSDIQQAVTTQAAVQEAPSQPTSTPAPESAPQSSPAPQQTSIAEAIAKKAAAVQASSQQAAQQSEAVVPAAPSWAPNFKVKSYDKEYEIDEMFRPLIKDQETEKKVRSIFEKAYGLDEMKPKYQKAREELEGVRPTLKEFDTLKSSLANISEMYNKGDLENFFKTIGVPDQVLFSYVQKRLEYNDLTPEKRAEYDRMVSSRNENYSLQSQYQSMEQQVQAMQTQIRGQEMRSVLSQPDVNEVAKQYDSAVGPGAFAQEVMNQGLFVWKTQGKDISAEEAVNLVMQRVKPLLGNVVSQQAAPTQQAAPVVPKPAVIPNISGTSTSPVKQKPKSLDDLRKLAKQI